MVLHQPSKLTRKHQGFESPHPLQPFLESLKMSKHPCKECLIRPLCKHKCNLFIDYTKKIKKLILYFNVFLVSLISITYTILLITIILGNTFLKIYLLIFSILFTFFFLSLELEPEKIIYFRLKDLKERHSYDI